MKIIRLNSIIELIDSCEKLADIGTDHGYIPVEVIKRKLAKKSIASDVNKGPLEKAIENIKKNNLQNYIEARLGSGLSVLEKEDEVDQVVIAGMGGHLIIELLNESKEIAQNTRLILQPMQAVDELRKFLYENGYDIKIEKIVEEGKKLYEIIVCEFTGEKIFLENYEVTEKMIRQNPDIIKKFLDNKINLYNHIQKGILKSQESKKDEMEILDKKLKYLKECILCN